jgi:hypothetical protein
LNSYEKKSFDTVFICYGNSFRQLLFAGAVDGKASFCSYSANFMTLYVSKNHGWKEVCIHTFICRKNSTLTTLLKLPFRGWGLKTALKKCSAFL